VGFPTATEGAMLAAVGSAGDTGSGSRGALAAAGGMAPQEPGVYFLLGPGGELLYVGKAGNLRRRLQQHAKADPPGAARLGVLYERVAEVRWEEHPTEAAAIEREADLLAALLPALNASGTRPAWSFVNVTPAGEDRVVLSVRAAPVAGGRSHGCFPRLDRGPGAGFTALLRLLWAASGEGRHMPASISRSAPDRYEVTAAPEVRRRLGAFLAGTSSRLLAILAEAAGAREGFMQPALGRDRRAAEHFYRYGPRALRAMRLAAGLPPGPLAPEQVVELMAGDLRSRIGDFRLPAVPDPTGGLLGSRHARGRTIGAALRGLDR
jgi:predicted GIY-YIG superfamily endonuclease